MQWNNQVSNMTVSVSRGSFLGKVTRRHHQLPAILHIVCQSVVYQAGEPQHQYSASNGLSRITCVEVIFSFNLRGPFKCYARVSHLKTHFVIKFTQYEHCIKVIQPLAIYLFRNPYPDDAIFEPSLKMEPGPAWHISESIAFSLSLSVLK